MPSPGVTITGTFASIIGAATGSAIFLLTEYGDNIPSVIGGGPISSPSQQTAVGSTFSITIYGNYQISPANTLYQVTFLSAAGQRISQAFYQFMSGGTFDMSALTPVTPISPTPFLLPVVVNPNGPQTIATYPLTAPVFNAITGFQQNSLAPNGNVLRGNGTDFVSAQLAYSDISGVPPGLAQNYPAVTNQWINSYNGTTGDFTSTQPSYSQISGTPVIPTAITKVTSEWLDSYNATTGAFTQSQPAYTDISGTPTIPSTKAEVASKWLDSYTATTGVFTSSQPSFSNISGTLSYSSLSGLPVIPSTIAAVTSKFLTSYTATTGAFTSSQPDYSDLTSKPQLPLNEPAVANNWITAYNSTTGAFSQAQPAYSDINMDSGYVIGRTTAGNGNAQEISIGSGLSMAGGVLSYSGSASAGAGINFYFYDNVAIPVGVNNAYEVDSIPYAPGNQAEQTDTIPVTAATSPAPWEFYITPNALGRTALDAGVWETNLWAYVSTVGGGRVSSIQTNIYDLFLGAGTATMTGTGTTRTLTVTGGTPFVAGDANASSALSGWIYIPIQSAQGGAYPISAFTSSSVVSITVPSTYTNGSALTYYVGRYLFNIPTATITNVGAPSVLYQTSSAQQQITLVGGVNDYLAIMNFGVSNNTTSVTFLHSGTVHPSGVQSPLIVVHNQLSGLQGGTSGQYYHLTSQQDSVVATLQSASGTTGTNTTNIVFSASPTLTGTPAIAAATATTPATGDNSTNVATTAFVNTIMSTVTVNVAGNTNVTLTAAQAQAFNIILTGALTGNIQVINGATTGDQWFVENATTGAHTITWIATSGTGVVLPQGYVSAVMFDGTNSVFGAPPVLGSTGSLGVATATSIIGLTAATTPNAAGGTTLGSASLPFGSVYIGNAATNNIQLTGTATGARVATFPDASTSIPIASQTLTFTGPTAARTITLPDSNFSVAPLTSPSFTTPNIGVASGTSLSLTGTLAMATGQVASWNSDVAISRLAANTLAIGTGAGDFSGTLKTGTVNATSAYQVNGSAPTGTNLLTGVTGSANGTTYLCGNNTWATPPGTAGAYVVVNDNLLNSTSPITQSSYTLGAQSEFTVLCYFRVVTATTSLVVTVAWNDATGAQSQTIAADNFAIGSHSVDPFHFNATTAANIVITATAGTANQVYLSTTIQSGQPGSVGNVTGPGSAVSGNLASYNGTSGTTIQDSGISALSVTARVAYANDAAISGTTSNVINAGIFTPTQTGLYLIYSTAYTTAAGSAGTVQARIYCDNGNTLFSASTAASLTSVLIARQSTLFAQCYVDSNKYPIGAAGIVAGATGSPTWSVGLVIQGPY